jgi:archaellum component FlaC
MGIIGNGRLRQEAEPMPPSPTDQQREAELREPEGRSPRNDLSGILARVSQTPDDTGRLKETIGGITQEPRAAINQIEQEISSLRDLMALREQMLLEAIDEHTNLSKEAVHGLGVVRKALGQIRDAFDATMRQIPALHQRVDVASEEP